MPTGIITFFIASKDYGFIKIPETREEIYFSLKNKEATFSPKRGMKVSFEIIENKHGLEAINLNQLTNLR